MASAAGTRETLSPAKVKTHLHGHHHNENDFHMFDGNGKSDPDDTDLEYITAILGSFNNIKTMQPHKNREPLKNFSSGEVYEDAAFHTCQNHQMTPPKFNYELIIKTLQSQKFSCEPTLDTDTEDHWTKIDIGHKIFESPEAPPIRSIMRSQRGSPFSTWCPFFPSNLHSDSSQNSPTRPSSQLSSTPQSFLPELPHKSVTTNSPFMTNWCPKISSVAYSHPKKTRNWKQHYSPVYLAKPADPWQSALRMEAIQKGMKVLYQQMEQALAKIEENVQRNCDLAERLARSPRAIKTIKDLDAAIATLAPIKEYKVSEYATRNKCWRRAPYQHPVPIQDLLLHDIQTRQDKNKLLGEKVGKIISQNRALAQQASSIYDTPSEKLKKDPIMNILSKTITLYWFTKHLNNPREENKF